MSDFLLEILVQELPYKFIPEAQRQLKEAFEKLFCEYGISYKKLDVQATPRRLAVLAFEIDDKQKDIVKELRGPILNIALDDKKEYTPAALGFAKKNGVTCENLYQKDNYIFAKVEIKGKSTKEILSENIENIIFKLQGPHFMRWGSHDEKFSRPIENILALYNSEVLPLRVLDKNSTNKTLGHRFSPNKNVTVTSPKTYIEDLKKAHVIVDVQERKNLIVQSATACAKEINTSIDFSNLDDLLEEVTYITEYPIPVLCEFDKRYLEIPDIVTTTVMSKHQRYFPLWQKDGKLSNHFITMANFVGNDKESMDNIKAGNQRVVSARLEDGIFFYKEDTRVPLENKIEELRGMTFQKGLGTLYDKTQRIVALSEKICSQLNIDNKDILRSALLCKADLSTKLVFEFTELQGFIGEEYALKSGEKQNVALAIKEHYFPLSAYSETPSKIEGQVVSIADKIDTICALFISTQGKMKKKRPTGSNDPLGARRAAIGILRIIINNNLDIDLKSLIDDSLKAISSEFNIELEGETNQDVYDFIINRLVVMYEKEFPQNIIKASLADDVLKKLVEFPQRAKFLKEESQKESFKKLAESANRVLRLSKDKTAQGVDEKLFVLDEEKALFSAIKNNCMEFKNLEQYMKCLENLVEPINNFFDKVLVMDKDEKIKNNRLALLNLLKEKFSKVCDFQYL